MKNDIKKIALLLTIFLCFTNAQNFGDYDHGKIHLKKGFIIEGKNLEFSDNNISINVSGSTQSYSLDEVKVIYSGKKNRFSLLGAFIGTAVIMTPMVLIGGDLTDMFLTLTLPISIGGGTVFGLLTPSMIGSKMKWTLLYTI